MFAQSKYANSAVSCRNGSILCRSDFVESSGEMFRNRITFISIRMDGKPNRSLCMRNAADFRTSPVTRAPTKTPGDSIVYECVSFLNDSKSCLGVVWEFEKSDWMWPVLQCVSDNTIVLKSSTNLLKNVFRIKREWNVFLVHAKSPDSTRATLALHVFANSAKKIRGRRTDDDGFYAFPKLFQNVFLVGYRYAYYIHLR